MIRHLDLFAGVGGFREAVERLGGRTVFWIENAEHARKVYKARHDPCLTPLEISTGMRDNWKDVDTLEQYAVQDIIPSFNLLTAGFPCQPYSTANVADKGVDHDKNVGVFMVIPWLLKVFQPKMFLLENVPALKTYENGRWFYRIQRYLYSEGYVIHHDVMDARPWVPQYRKRLWIAGFLRRKMPYAIFDFHKMVVPPQKYWPRFADIMQWDVPMSYTLSDKMMGYMQRREDNMENGFGYQFINVDDAMGTLIASYDKMGGRSYVIEQQGRNPRRLTETEGVRLMGLNGCRGFDEVSMRDRWRLMGNAVVVPQVMEILRTMTDYMELL